VITIGQLARYAGVSTKTIRVYHAKGLLPEPSRDSSGYRRYSAQHAIDLIKIRTLAEAGVPLGRIGDLQAASGEEFRRLLHMLPPEVTSHLERLPGIGFSPRWIAMETDLWILVFATHPDTASELFRDQAQALTDQALRQIYLDYDRAYGLDPNDPRLGDLAQRIVAATRSRYGPGDLPGQVTGSAIPALIQESINASSPAWQRLDTLIRDQLHT